MSKKFSFKAYINNVYINCTDNWADVGIITLLQACISRES